MSADLSGFTKLSEKLAAHGREGAEELTDLLNECFTGMISHVDALGGDVLKFGGDALLVLFTGAEHAARASLAAIGMREVIRKPLETRQGKVRLRISQGIHSGSFEIQVLHASHTELVVTGEGATETVQCESIAEAGQILLSPAAAALLDPRDVKHGPEGRFLLVRAPKCTVIDLTNVHLEREHDPADFIPAAQREQIVAGATSEHRWVAISFIKFSHTDELVAREGAEALLAKLQRLAEVVDEVCVDAGVHWMATDVAPDGGKFILAAGAPIAFGEDEDRLVRAVRAILDRVTDLDLRAGVNCGAVFAGNLGGPTRRAFTIMGDAVNLTARLMQAAGHGELLASEAIMRRCRTRFRCNDVEPFYVKGKSAPVRATRVMAIDSSAVSLSAVDSYPLVGRAGEMARLHAACDDAIGGDGRFVEIVGESGTGKTRLLDELIKLRGDLRRLRVECGQYARQSPYFAMRILLRTIAGVPLDSGRVEAGDALRNLVERVAPDELPMLPLLAVPFDATVAETVEASQIAPEFWREIIVRVIARLVAGTLTAPTLIVVEDAHWVDESSREILERLATDVERGPWVLLVTRRPGEPPLAPTGLTEHVVIDLGPLDANAAIELGMAAGGDASRLPPGEWDTIAERSGGNPLFVIELANAAVTSGSAESVTNSVESLITARIDSLAPSDRVLLREAAVLGLVVDLNLYATATGDRSVANRQRWNHLGAFVATEGGHLIRFRNILYRDVAYEGLAYRRRREMHRRLAETLDTFSSPPAALCSLHFERAGIHAKAWEYSVAAGRAARKGYANVEAAELFRRALRCARFVEWLSQRDVSEIAEELGDVSELAARFDDASAALATARRGWRDDATRLASIMRKEGWIRERVGQYANAIRWYRRGIALTSERTDGESRAVLAELELGMAGVRHRQGRYSDAVRWGEQAIGHATEAGDREALAHAHVLLQAGEESLGRPDHERHLEVAVELYGELGDLVGQAKALSNLGASAHVSGDWPRALPLYEESRSLAIRAGDVVSSAFIEFNIGELLSGQGRLAEAEESLRHAVTNLRSAHHAFGEAFARMQLGVTLARAGNVDEGLAALDAAVAHFDQLGATGVLRTARVLRAEALLLAGRQGDAIAEAEAVASVKASVEPAIVSAARRVQGVALAAQGDLDEAARRLRDALTKAYEAEARDQIALAAAALASVLERLGHDEASELRARAIELSAALGFVNSPG